VWANEQFLQQYVFDTRIVFPSIRSKKACDSWSSAREFPDRPSGPIDVLALDRDGFYA